MAIAVLIGLGMAPGLRADPLPDQFCQDLSDGLSSLVGSPVTVNHDACVACETVVKNDSTAGKVCICKILQDNNVFPIIGVKNLGGCVSVLAKQDFGAGNMTVATLSVLMLGFVGFQIVRRRRGIATA